jgi:DHA1 family bicyclomycin/chloramphenicol resistance-like MFS transporter
MISPLSIDTFLPSFPAIAAEFHLSRWQVQQIITAYLAPFACFALVHGPLSDALGRRRVVLGGVLLYTAASIGCVFAPTFSVLLVCRAFQGMAAGIGPTVARAVVRDLYEGVHAQRLMSTMMLVFSIAPAAAPILGGWLHVSFGWRSVFAFMVLLGVTLIAVAWFMLPETHPPEKRTAFKPSALASSCWRVGSNPIYFLLSLSAALTFASILIYIGSSPAIILEQWHLKETQFYYLFVPIIGGFMVASIVSGRMAGNISRLRQLQLAFGLTTLGTALSFLSQTFLGSAPLLLTQMLLFVTAFGTQLIFPLLSLQMIDMYPNARGAASSVQAFIALGVGALVMGLVAPAINGSMPQLAIISLVGNVLAYASWRAAEALRHRK